MSEYATQFGLTLVTAADTEPITVAEAKVQCKVDGTDEDDYISGLISMAREHVEGWLGRRLVTQTWDYKRDCFPVGDREIIIPYGPVQSITSITYVDSAGDSTVMSSSDYTLDTASFTPRVYPVYNEIWPVARDVRNAITIRYVAGYGAYTAVPSQIRHAIKLLVAQMYKEREPVVVGTIVSKLPYAIENLLNIPVIVAIFFKPCGFCLFIDVTISKPVLNLCLRHSLHSLLTSRCFRGT